MTNQTRKSESEFEAAAWSLIAVCDGSRNQDIPRQSGAPWQDHIAKCM